VAWKDLTAQIEHEFEQYSTREYELELAYNKRLAVHAQRRHLRLISLKDTVCKNSKCLAWFTPIRVGLEYCSQRCQRNTVSRKSMAKRYAEGKLRAPRITKKLTPAQRAKQTEHNRQWRARHPDKAAAAIARNTAARKARRNEQRTQNNRAAE